MQTHMRARTHTHTHASTHIHTLTHAHKHTNCQPAAGQNWFSFLPGQPQKSVILQGRDWLVSWCIEPSQPQLITSGLNINFRLSPSYSFHKSLHPKSCFSAYSYSAGTQHGNLHPTGWPIVFCGPTREPELATADTGKKLEEIWKKCRWMDRKGRNKQGRNPWQ